MVSAIETNPFELWVLTGLSAKKVGIVGEQVTRKLRKPQGFLGCLGEWASALATIKNPKKIEPVPYFPPNPLTNNSNSALKTS